MSDQTDPWATVQRLNCDCCTVDGLYAEQWVMLAAQVDAARAEEERRHAEALDALKATHEAAMAAAGRSHAQALEKVRAQLAAVQSPLGVYARHLRELAQTLDDGVANPPAVETVPHWTIRHLRTLAESMENSKPLTLKEPTEAKTLWEAV